MLFLQIFKKQKDKKKKQKRQRLAEQRRLAERQRLAEQRRLAEDKRLAEENNNISTAIAISTHIQEAKLETSDAETSDADTVTTDSDLDSYSSDVFETESVEEEQSGQNTHTQIGTATAMAILNSNLIKKTSANKGGPPQTTNTRVIDPNQFKEAVSTAVAIHINNQKDLSSPTGVSPNSSRSSSPGPPQPPGDLTNDEEGIIAGITAIVMLLIKTIIKQKMGDLIILDESDRKHKQCKQLIEQEYSQYKDDDLKQVIYTSYDNEKLLWYACN